MNKSKRGNFQIQDPDKRLEKFMLVITLLLVFIIAARTPLDSDLWWHLRSGEETIKARTPLLSDGFSYTKLGSDWINHSWLSQVILYLVFIWGEYLGLSLYVSILAVVSMLFVWLQLDNRGVIGAFITILGSIVASVVWSPRPQITSLVLFAIVSYLLFLYKWRGIDRLWLLIPIFVLWSNLHGGFPLGFMLVGLIILGEGLNKILNIQGPEQLSRRKIIRLMIWIGFSAFAVLLNPNGFSTWIIPFKTVGVEALQNLVSEWASPDFHQPIQQLLLLLLFLIITAIGLSRKRVDGTDLLILLWFAYLAFIARRNFGPFAIVAIPILSRQILRVRTAKVAKTVKSESKSFMTRIRKFIQTSSTSRISDKKQMIINLLFIAFLGLIGFLKIFIVTYPALVDRYLMEQVPLNAINWIENNQPDGNLFSEYNWGGYLIWHLRDYPVFVDGRTDLFGDEILGEWIIVTQAEDGWEHILEKWDVNMVLLGPNRVITKMLAFYGWAEEFADENSIIFTR